MGDMFDISTDPSINVSSNTSLIVEMLKGTSWSLAKYYLWWNAHKYIFPTSFTNAYKYTYESLNWYLILVHTFINLSLTLNLSLH